MATVAVNSFAEFVAAAAVAGDTVVCPVKAKWEMNDLYPEGYNGDINLHCAEIQGNGTTINNLHIFGRFYKKYELHINDLNITNFVCDLTATSYPRMNCFISSDGADTGTLYMDGCIISGICNNGVEKFCYRSINLNRCSMTLQFTRAGGSTGICNELLTATYCRIRQECTKASNVDIRGSFCEYDIHIPNATNSNTVNFYNAVGCKIIGNAGGARTTNGNNARAFPCIVIDTFSENQSAMTWVPAVTFTQMYDAAYLSSLGFPVGVS